MELHTQLYLIHNSITTYGYKYDPAGYVKMVNTIIKYVFKLYAREMLFV